MIQPLYRNIVVEEIDDKTSKFYVPETTEQNKGYYKGKVVAVGQGVRNSDGTISPLLVKKGDVILFWKYGPIKVDGKEYMVTLEEQVIAILKNEK